MTRIVLASPDLAFETWVREAFEGRLNGDLRQYTDEPESYGSVADVATDLTAGGPDIVAFGPDVPLDTALGVARHLDRSNPEVTVILVTKPTGKLWEQAMKAGVDVVLTPDALADEVRDEFERALEAAERRRANVTAEADDPSRGHRVIVVISPKGGAGKSVVSSNLAVGLAQAAPGKVAIVDLDLQFGDVAGSLQLIPDHTMADVAQLNGHLDLTSLKVYLTPHAGSLYALCAPDSPVDGEQISVDLIGKVLGLLSEEFRFVVVDTSGGISEHTLAALEVATDFVFVGAMDVPSVRSLRKEVEALDALGMTQQKRHFVLNRSDTRVGLDRGDVEATIGLSVDVAIPSSRAIPVSFNQGQPIVSADPRSPVARELMKLVARFAEVPAAAAAGGLFRRRTA
jgi:pilus assembly protein CpaE